MIDAAACRHVGPQAGSNPGGLFEDSTGRRFYVKPSRSLEHAANEVLAASLYRAAGIAVPDVELAGWAGAPAVASKWLPGLRRTLSPVSRHGFAVDAWLGNYDAVPMLTPACDVVRVDCGAAMLYSATGKPRRHLFGPHVTGVDTFRDPAVCPVAAWWFAGMDEDEVAADVAATVAGIPDATIDALVDALPFEPEVAAFLRDRLKVRRDDLAHRFAPVVAL